MASSRYARQIELAGYGSERQQRLTNARVVVIGCGGLGSPAAAYLAGAGVGHLRLIDPDRVSLSNLHRQVFYGEDDELKVTALASHLRRLNSEIRIETLARRFDAASARAVLKGATLVLDCTDDAYAKHLISDTCSLLGIPLVYAAAQGYAGYLALFENREGGIHLRDVYPEPDPSLPDCATTGVLPTAVGTVALLQANAALCYLLAIGEPPVDMMLTYSALDNVQRRIKLTKTYHRPIEPPWSRPGNRHGDLEIAETTLAPAGYAKVYSMIDPQREPDLPAGTVRLDSRNPVRQLLDDVKPDRRYLVYCNSGKLSLVLVSQIRQQHPGIEIYSLAGGKAGIDS